ncbi:Mbov_0397 family ICE element conjugal transfer ATPase [Mycoplasma sp. 4423]
MLQPKRLKKRWMKLTKWFSLKDGIEFLIVLIVSYGISYISFAKFYLGWVQYVFWLVLILVFGILILPHHGSNGKVYHLIYRMFLYWLAPKKYTRFASKGARSSEQLNPFARLYGVDIVQNKKTLGEGINKKDINSNMFCVFAIHGFNLENEDPQTQEIMLTRYIQSLDSFNNKFSFVKIDENVNFKENIKFLDENKIDNEKWNDYLNANYEDLNSINENLQVSNYYLIVNGPNFKELSEEAQVIYNKFLESKIYLSKLEGVELLKFLNNYRGFGVSEDEIVSWYTRNLAKIQNEEECGDILDELFSYNEVVFNRNYFKINDKFYSIKGVSKLPYELDQSWSAGIFNLNGVIISNHYPYNDKNAVDRILNKANMDSTNNIETEVQATKMLKANIDMQAVDEFIYQITKLQHKLYDVNYFIINSANDFTTLKELERENNVMLRSQNIKVNNLSYLQFQAFIDTSLSLNYKLSNLAYQMTSYVLGNGYPFLYEIFNDNKNLVFGLSQGSSAPISFDIFDLKSSNRTNHNMMVLGSSGIGKSTIVSKILASNLAIKNKVIIIDPQNEYSDFARKFGGQIIDIGGGAKTTINLMQVRNALRDDIEELSVAQLINSHVSLLEKFFKTLWSIDEEWYILESLFKEFYASYGFYQQDISKLKHEQWPIISDFINFMKEYKYENIFNVENRKKVISMLIDRFDNAFLHHGKYEMLFNGITNINLENDFIVFKMNNLTNTNEHISAKLGIMLVLSFCNEVIYQNFIENEKKRNLYKQEHNLTYLSSEEIDKLTTRIILCIDEEHIYINAKNPATLDYIVEATKTIRKFDGSTIHTTQNPSDYRSSSEVIESASRIIQNCNYSIFLGMKSNDINAVKELYENSANPLTPSEINLLAQKQRGQCLLGINENIRYKVNLHYNDYEKSLFFKKG